MGNLFDFDPQKNLVPFEKMDSLDQYMLRQTLALVDDPSVLGPMEVSAERVRAKLGWLMEFRAELAEWSAFQEVIDGVLDFVRHEGWRCVTNLSDGAVPLPAGEVLLTSGPLEDGLLGPDTTAWLG